MWYSSFRSKYKIQPMEKFSGEGSFLFQNDSEPDLWGARFAKQGQVLQVRSISRPLRPPRSWPPTKVCPENWNFKGWGQQIYFFLQILSRTTWILTGKPWKCQRKLWTGAGNAVCWSRQEKLKVGNEVRFEVLDDDGGGKVEHLGSCVASIEQVLIWTICKWWQNQPTIKTKSVSQSNIIIPFPKVEEASKQQQRLGLKVLNSMVDNNLWYT